jgi:hypothetical protein
MEWCALHKNESAWKKPPGSTCGFPASRSSTSRAITAPAPSS